MYSLFYWFIHLFMYFFIVLFIYSVFVFIYIHDDPFMYVSFTTICCSFLNVLGWCARSPPNRSWRLKSVDDIWRHGPFHEPPSGGAVGAGRLDVEQLDEPKWFRHEHCHSSREQGGHAWFQGWLLCLEGDFELRRSGTAAEAGPECVLAKWS